MDKPSWLITDEEKAENRRKLRETQAEKQHVQMQLAETRGRAKQVRDSLAQDQTLREQLRAIAWQRHSSVRPTLDENQRPTNLPNGWPDGVDGEQFIQSYLDEGFADLLNDEDTGTDEGAPARPSPLVTKFREAVEGGSDE